MLDPGSDRGNREVLPNSPRPITPAGRPSALLYAIADPPDADFLPRQRGRVRIAGRTRDGPTRTNVASSQRCASVRAMIEDLLAVSRSGAGSVLGLKVFFAILEVLLVAAGIYIFRQRKKLFGYKGEEGDTYASANLRMIMVVLVWIHAVIITALMIYEI